MGRSKVTFGFADLHDVSKKLPRRYTWIFQACKICAFSPEKATKRHKFYVFGRSRYTWMVINLMVGRGQNITFHIFQGKVVNMVHGTCYVRMVSHAVDGSQIQTAFPSRSPTFRGLTEWFDGVLFISSFGKVWPSALDQKTGDSTNK